MKKFCASCGEPFEAKRSTAKYCSGRCRVKAQRTSEIQAPAPRELPTDVPRELDRDEVGLVTAARGELVAAGRLETAGGQVVMTLAHRIASAMATETGAGLAALAKEFRASMDAATANAQQAADPIDELRARRDGKRSG